jgi:hypothetical protein
VANCGASRAINAMDVITITQASTVGQISGGSMFFGDTVYAWMN